MALRPARGRANREVASSEARHAPGAIDTNNEREFVGDRISAWDEDLDAGYLISEAGG